MEKVGSNIDGNNEHGGLGTSVALSADSTILAVGTPYDTYYGWNDKGTVRVFQLDDTSSSGWTQLGQDLVGENNCDIFGSKVALSDDGMISAVGAEENDGANGNNYGAGHVRVFQQDTTTSLGWSQIGGDLDGERSYDSSGENRALSCDGDVIAIGASDNQANGLYGRYSSWMGTSWWRY